MSLYDRLYPHYVEIAALSQIRPIWAPLGGRAGHAVMYLKGVCRREDASIPLLRMCGESEIDPHDENAGVGVSVNKIFRNVNWVAVPGRTFLLRGKPGFGPRLTREESDATVREAIDLRLYRGVEIHARYLGERVDGRSTEEFVASQCIGTDYALNHGRTIFSVKLPVTRPMLESMIGYLNDLNLLYASDAADYNWSGTFDNCVHTVHNTLAAAGVWSPIPVGAVKLLRRFRLAVPANEFIHLAALANEFPLERFCRVYANPVLRRSLVERSWLPARHGALLETIPVRAENDLYDPTLRMLMIEPALFFARNRRRGRRMLADPRYTDLAENLRCFESRYAGILGRARARRGASITTGWAVARRAYASYVEAQLEDVREKQRVLSAPASSLFSADRPR